MAVAGSPIATATAPVSARGPAAEMAGRWQVARIVDYAPVTAMTEGEAAAIVGRRLTVSSRNVRFMDRRCSGSGWTRARIGTVGFLDRYRIARPAGYPASVVIATPRCRAGASLGPFMMLPKRVSFVWQGALLEAERLSR